MFYSLRMYLKTESEYCCVFTNGLYVVVVVLAVVFLSLECSDEVFFFLITFSHFFSLGYMINIHFLAMLADYRANFSRTANGRLLRTSLAILCATLRSTLSSSLVFVCMQNREEDIYVNKKISV
jgi:hypothetical protein